jgi:hypothetical protein
VAPSDARNGRGLFCVVVTAIAFAANGDVILGGTFSGASVVGSNGTLTRSRLAAANPTTLAITTFAPVANSDVLSLAHGGTTLFVGGSFTVFGGGSRPRLAAVSDAGAVLSLRLNLNRTVAALAFDAGQNALYVGGSFTERVLAVNATTGTALTWPARIGPNNSSVAGASTVLGLALDSDRVMVGGTFRSAGGLTRLGIAALDLTTGNATAFAPFATQEKPLKSESNQNQQ